MYDDIYGLSAGELKGKLSQAKKSGDFNKADEIKDYLKEVKHG